MSRVDAASKSIRATAAHIYTAFATRNALENWLAPQGMCGQIFDFDFREGGGYRMRLTFQQPQYSAGKTTADSDEVTVRFIKLVPNERIEQAVVFNSPDPAFAGEMQMTWTFTAQADATLVTVRCEQVPAGIHAEDHRTGLMASLNNLAAYVEV